MDYKIRGFQNFKGRFFHLDVKISQKIIDLLPDEGYVDVRKKCQELEHFLWEYLKDFEEIAVREDYEKTNVETNEETSPETVAETSEETSTIEFSKEPESGRVTIKGQKIRSGSKLKDVSGNALECET